MFYQLKCFNKKNRAVGHDDIALRAVIFALCASYIVLADNDIAAKPQLRNIQIFFSLIKLLLR